MQIRGMKFLSILGAVSFGLICTATILFFMSSSAQAARSSHPQLEPTAFCDTVSEIPQSECEALVALYTSTNGTNWITRTNWLTTNTPCNWYGISCGSGQVYRIELPENNLSGSLPSGIGNFSQLNTLDLSHNYIGGPLLPELSNLTNLSWLIFWDNQLEGNIPPELGALSHLNELDLSVNQLTGTIPIQLGDLSNLQTIFLDNNHLSGHIPGALNNLTNLTGLSLGNNNLDGTIPDELAGMTQLTGLGLDHNQLTGSIPTWIGDLTNLVDLDLGGNQFTGTLPASLGNLTNLTYLSTGFNNFTPAPLPPEFNNMTSMRELFVNDSNLTGPLPDLSNLTNMEILWAGGNQMDGPIPLWLGDLITLTELGINDQLFSGTIPAEIGNLTNLTSLWINGNRDLGGEIPTTITNLVNLIPEDWATRFGYNKLYSDDPAVIAFMNEKDPDWADTQTVPPEDPTVTQTLMLNTASPQGAVVASLELVWTPIPFSDGPGYYEISYATDEAGPYTVHGTTTDKTVGSYLVDKLDPFTTYYLRIRTFSSDVGGGHFDMWSEYSNPVLGTTGAGKAMIYLPLTIHR